MGKFRWRVSWDAVAVFLLAAAVLIPAVFWGKFHDDEIIYWDIARNIGHGLGPVSLADPFRPGLFVWHLPFASYLVAPLTWFWDDLVPARVVTALVAAAGTVALYRVGERQLGRRTAWVAVGLAISSFYFLRFGGRFYYDAFGFALFWWAVEAYLGERWASAGALFVMTVAFRELWLLPVAVFVIAAWFTPGCKKFLIGAAATALGGLLWLFATFGVGTMLANSAIWNGASQVAHGSAGNTGMTISAALRAWVQMLAAGGMATAGALVYLGRKDRRFPYSLLGAAVAAGVTLSVTPGILANGGFTQYPFMLLGFLALLGAAGMEHIFGWLGGWMGRNSLVVMALACLIQVVAGSWFISSKALYGSTTIYGLGVGQDREVIALLRREARPGQRISGIHGAYVNGAHWFWIDRHIEYLSMLKPDWIVIYGAQVNVEVIPGTDRVWSIGAYKVIQMEKPDRVDQVIKPR